MPRISDYLGAKKSRKPPKGEEDQLQRMANKYLELKKIRYIHLPKEIQRYVWTKKFNIPVQVGAAASRALKGVPDLILFGTDLSYQLIELKSARGRLTPEQEAWLPHGLLVFRDFETFRNHVDAWATLHC